MRAADPSPRPARQPPPVPPTAATVSRPGRVAAVAAVAVLVVGVLAVLDLTQGTADVGPAEVWRAVTGRASAGDASVLVASRVPRMAAGLLVGAALGAAGTVLQAVTRNVLAAPDTLAVNAGANLALTVVAVTGASVPLLASSGVAFAGGLAAAALVLALSGPAGDGIRLVLAGSALALGVGAVTDALVLLFPQQTVGTYQWSRGSISQSGPDGVLQVLPVVAVAAFGLALLARRLDTLALGDDAARSIGVPVGATRVLGLGCAVLLSAAAVTLAGPVGFVGLCAPALVRLATRRVRGASRVRVGAPLAALTGAGLVLGADVLLRASVGADVAVGVPTGVVTSLLGAVFLVALAFRVRDSATAAPPSRRRAGPRVPFAATVVLLAAGVVAVGVAAVLLGDRTLLLGDVWAWARGDAGSLVSYVLSTRVPRVAAAGVAGAALAVAGTGVQAATRNPLAEPGILGVSGGAGLGAVLLVTTVPLAGPWQVAGAATAGALLSAGVVFGLSVRGGFGQNRLVLVGVGVSAATTALISLVLVLTDPFNATKALTWLSGSTYGRTAADVVPVLAVLLLALVVLGLRHRELDLLSVDEDTPRLLGVRLGPARLVVLAVAVLLTASAVAALGVIGFVGLIAPHAARALVGRRTLRVLPVAALLGAALVCLADLLGRTVIAPAQLGAGLLTALVGAPCFVWLLWRSRS